MQRQQIWQARRVGQRSTGNEVENKMISLEYRHSRELTGTGFGVSAHLVKIGNRTECALLALTEALGADYELIRGRTQVERVFSFTSDRKRMTSITRPPNPCGLGPLPLRSHVCVCECARVHECVPMWSHMHGLDCSHMTFVLQQCSIFCRLSVHKSVSIRLLWVKQRAGICSVLT